MFESLPRQVADEAKSIATARIDVWAAMNANVLDCVEQLVRLNLDTSRRMMADTLEAMKLSGSAQSEQQPDWEKYCYLPQDAGSFLLYGREAGNLCAAMQKEVGNFFRNSFSQTMRDLPLLSPYAASDDGGNSPFVHMRHAGEADGQAQAASAASAPARKNARSRVR